MDLIVSWSVPTFTFYKFNSVFCRFFTAHEENFYATHHSDLNDAEKRRKSKSSVGNCEGNPVALPVSSPCGKPSSQTLQKTAPMKEHWLLVWLVMIKCSLKPFLLKYQGLEGFHVIAEEKAARTMVLIRVWITRRKLFMEKLYNL